MSGARSKNSGGPDLLPNVTLKQLSYFMAAALHQSVVRAAEAISISPPSISAAIAHLERLVGVQLFVRRHARGLVLTQAGRDLAADARIILAHAREIETTRQPGAHRLQGRLEIGCLVSFAPFIIPPLLHSFAAAHPQARIRWREADHEALIAGLEEGALEVALLYDFEVPSTVQCTRLRPMPPQAVMPGGHRLSRRRTVHLRELADEPFILLDLPRTQHYFLSIFGELGLEPKIAHRAQSYEMARSLVANGFGYTLLNFCPPYAYPGHGILVSRPIGGRVRCPHLVFAKLYRYKPPRIVEEFQRYAQEFALRLPVATDGPTFRRAGRRSRGRS